MEGGERGGEEGRKGGKGKGKWRMTDTHARAFLQLKAHKRGIEETEVTINMLLKRQNEDKVRLVLTTASVHRLPPQPPAQVNSSSVTYGVKSASDENCGGGLGMRLVYRLASLQSQTECTFVLFHVGGHL